MFIFSKILTLLGSFLLTATYRRKGQQVETACLYVQHSARFQSRNPLILPQPASESRQGCPGAPHPLAGRSEGWRPCDGPGLGPEALLASARCRGNVSRHVGVNCIRAFFLPKTSFYFYGCPITGYYFLHETLFLREIISEQISSRTFSGSQKKEYSS